MPGSLVDVVLAAVKDERARQDTLWGEQNHDYAKYFAIAAEEHGEVAKDVVELTFFNLGKYLPSDGLRAFRNLEDHFMTECIQTAAVHIAMVECVLRRRNPMRNVTRETQEAYKDIVKD